MKTKGELVWSMITIVIIIISLGVTIWAFFLTLQSLAENPDISHDRIIIILLFFGVLYLAAKFMIHGLSEIIIDAIKVYKKIK